MECQHSNHADRHDQKDAALWVLAVCPKCGKRKQYAICQYGFDELMNCRRLRCAGCQDAHPPSESLSVVRPVD